MVDSVHQVKAKKDTHGRCRVARYAFDFCIAGIESSIIPPSQAEFCSWRSGDRYEYPLPQRDSWEHCHKLVDEHDSEMCNAWKDEVANLLIFAGLFSAAVTAFIIESYKWLQQDSSSYQARQLSLIYELLNPETGSQKLSSISDPWPRGPVVRINIYWFLGLTLSLSTVLIGLIAVQWIREYQREIYLPLKGKLALRQMRYEGLVYWQVPRIIASLPLLLQAGFVLFLLGIVELLWVLDRAVAIPVTVVVGPVFFFLLVTILLPTIQHVFPTDMYLDVPQCPYKSPQS
ncbi:hypothetical protein B0H34DRAFT_659038, partial [Crassisporium funariophilum]